MPITLHTLYMIDLDSIVIDQIGSQGISPEVSEIIAAGDGQVFPSHVSAGRIAPVIAFSTSGLAAALGKFAPDGFFITTGNVAVLYFRKRIEGGLLAVGSNHIKATVNEGICVPRILSADQESAILTGEIVATWDGTNAPVVVAGSQALAGTPAINEQYVAGPVVVNNVQLEGITSIEIDFGIRLTVPAHDGHVYPMYVAIAECVPVITVRTIDAVALSTFGIAGTAQGATATAVYLRGKEQGGSNYANNTSNHIKIVNTVSKGMITVRQLAAEQGGDAEAEIKITGASAGTANPLTITTGTTIPGAI